MPSELPRSKEALVFAWGANASALPLFPAGGETDWRIRSTGPQDSFSAVAAAPPGAFRAKTHRRRCWSHDGHVPRTYESAPGMDFFRSRMVRKNGLSNRLPVGFEISGKSV